MKLTKADAGAERMVLTGMIVNNVVCGRIASRWQRDLFRSKYANLVAKWCVDFHAKYGKAPGRQVESLFRSWSERTHDQETVKLVEKFLGTLSDEYAVLRREVNPEYVLDKAGQHFGRVQIERLRDALEDDLVTGDVGRSTDRILGFGQIKLGPGEAIDIFNDKAAWKQAFTDPAEPIIKYTGLLGKFLGNQFGRGMFVGIMGPEGRGKSYVLMDIAFRAALQRRKVVFFEAGDMERDQLLRRLASRIANRPMFPCTVQYPTGIRKRKKGFTVDTRDRVFHKRLDWRKVIKGCKKIRRVHLKSKEPYFRLVSFPNSTLHVNTIETMLREWEREGWVADVVVIDYADILDMTYPHIDGRDRIDMTWRKLRSLSQKFHNLVVTATQTNRASYDAKVISRKHSSEDKRKLAHVTAMLGLNQTEKEKKMQVMRFNWVKVRDAPYYEHRCVAVAGCLALGNIAVRSCL